MRPLPPIDIDVPSDIVGRRPSGQANEEAEVNAWGPFEVWLEDADPGAPAYVGSRLLFFWDRLSTTPMVRFFPAEPPSMKIYTVLDGDLAQPGLANISDAGFLQFKTLEHGWCEIRPVPTDQLALARRACSLV